MVLGGTCTPFNPITVNGQPATDPAQQRLVQGQIFDPYSTRLVNGSPRFARPYRTTRFLADFHGSGCRLDSKVDSRSGICRGDISKYTVPSYTSFTHTTNFSIKADQNSSPTIKLSGYYAHNKNFAPFANGLPGVFGNADTNNTNHTIRLNYDQSHYGPRCCSTSGSAGFPDQATATSRPRSIRRPDEA